MKRVRRRRLDLTTVGGIAIGLGMTVRIGGLLGLVYCAMIVGLQWLAFCLHERRLKPALELLGGLTLRGLLVTAVAWTLMILPWPASHRVPFTLPFQALSGFTKHSFTAKTLFRGEYVPSNPSPWNYLPGYFLVELPDVLLLILAIGALILAMYLARPTLRRTLWNWRGACVALLIFAVEAFPFKFGVGERSLQSQLVVLRFGRQACVGKFANLDVSERDGVAVIL